MTAQQSPHWAADLVGKPYRRGADGPDAYGCWGLLRVACLLRHGVLIPAAPDPLADIPADRADAHRLVHQCQQLGWARVDQAFGAARDGDVVLMRSATREPHVGMAIDVQGRVELLHAQTGGVVRQPLLDLHLLGYTAPQVWRWVPAA